MNKKEAIETCENCKFYTTGNCYRYPPVITPVRELDVYGYWITGYEERVPCVNKDGWCGEYDKNLTCAPEKC